MLNVRGLNAFYGQGQVLHDVGFHVNRGELVTLLGRNGAGKTTTLRAILALVRRTGSIRYDGKELIAMSTEQIARLGIGYVPEERAIFGSLSVGENLILPPAVKPGGMTLDEVLQLFPNLKERQANQGTKLSGGEQQMLAIGRILRTGSDFILLDEPTEGLAPVIVQQIGEAIRAFKRRGFTILLVEQNFHFARSVADRHYIFEEGHVVDVVDNSELTGQAVVDRLNRLLGV